MFYAPLALIIGLISMSRRSFFFGLIFAIGLLMIAQMEAHAATIWSLADSAEWRSKRDSIFTAISHLGGHPVGCATVPAQRWFANGAYYVKLSDFYLKVRAEKIERDSPAPMPWVLSVEGFPQMPYECMNRPDHWR